MKTITKPQLEEKFGSNDDTILVNVLPFESFKEEHIPGSISIPLESDDFLKRFARETSSENQEIIVYCASMDCYLSHKAAQKLEEAGYRNVFIYSGGMRDWRQAGGQTRLFLGGAAAPGSGHGARA